MENEKILEALRTIRSVCYEHSMCVNCPLRTSYGCGLTENQPYKWTLFGDIKDTDKLFVNS